MHSCWSKRSEACSYKRSEIRSEKRSYKNYLKGAVPYTHYETPSFKTLPAENWNFRRRRKRFRKKIRTFDAVENASGRKLELSTLSKMLPEENRNFRRCRKCFRRKIRTFDAVEGRTFRKNYQKSSPALIGELAKRQLRLRGSYTQKENHPSPLRGAPLKAGELFSYFLITFSYL